MKTIEEVRKELLICKEVIEQNLEILNRLEKVTEIEEEEETEMLVWRGRGRIIKGYDKGEISICFKERIDMPQEDTVEYKIVLLVK